jgi:hypothetical protein
MKKTTIVSSKKIVQKNGKAKRGDLFKLLTEVAKFREANKKFLIPDLYAQKQKKYKVIQLSNTSDMDAQMYG